MIWRAQTNQKQNFTQIVVTRESKRKNHFLVAKFSRKIFGFICAEAATGSGTRDTTTHTQIHTIIVFVANFSHNLRNSSIHPPKNHQILITSTTKKLQKIFFVNIEKKRIFIYFLFSFFLFFSIFLSLKLHKIK